MSTYNRVEACKSSTDGQTGETGLGDGSVDYSLGAKSVQQALCDFVTVRHRDNSTISLIDINHNLN